MKLILGLSLITILNAINETYININVCKCNGMESSCEECKLPPKEGVSCGILKSTGKFDSNFSDNEKICIQSNPKLTWCYRKESICDLNVDKEKSGDKPSPDIKKTTCNYLNPLISSKLTLDVYENNISEYPNFDKSGELEEIYHITGCRLSLYKKLNFKFTRFTSIFIYAFISVSDETIDSNPEGYIISIKGTSMDSTADLVSDIQILFNSTPLLYSKAKETLDTFFYDQVEVKRKVANIVGHSLGGAVAQLLAMAYKFHCTSFDSPGVVRLAQNLGLSFDGEIELFTSIPHWVNTFGENIHESTLLLIEQPNDCKIFDISNAVLIDDYSNLPKDFPATTQVLFQNYFTYRWDYLVYYHEIRKIYKHIKQNGPSFRVENMKDFKKLNCLLHQKGYVNKFYTNLLSCFKPKYDNFLKNIEDLHIKYCNTGY